MHLGLCQNWIAMMQRIPQVPLLGCRATLGVHWTSSSDGCADTVTDLCLGRLAVLTGLQQAATERSSIVSVKVHDVLASTHIECVSRLF